MPRKSRDDTAAGKQLAAKQALKKFKTPKLPYNLQFLDDQHKEEFTALCKIRCSDQWNKEELRYLYMSCILNRALCDSITQKDWGEANQINALCVCINRQLGVLTQPRQQAQARREADTVEKMRKTVGNDSDFIDQ